MLVPLHISLPDYNAQKNPPGIKSSLFSWFPLSIFSHRLTLDFTDFFICIYLRKSMAKFKFFINLRFYIWSNNPNGRVPRACPAFYPQIDTKKILSFAKIHKTQ
jgi:hypothetical protein